MVKKGYGWTWPVKCALRLTAAAMAKEGHKHAATLKNLLANGPGEPDGSFTLQEALAIDNASETAWDYAYNRPLTTVEQVRRWMWAAHTLEIIASNGPHALDKE